MSDSINNNSMDCLEDVELDLDPQEYSQLQKLAGRVTDISGEMTEVTTLIRYLRARDGNVDKAEQMLRKSVKWREENNVVSYRRGYKLPPALQDDYIIEVIGNDYEGHPVVYAPLGQWNIRDKISEGYLEETMEARFYMLEAVIMDAISRSQKHQFVLLVDLSGLTFYKVAHLETTNVVIKIFQDFDHHYPERLRAAFVVNPPWVFPYAFSLIKPWLAPKTLSKVNILHGDRNKWLNTLKTSIPEEILPTDLSA